MSRNKPSQQQQESSVPVGTEAAYHSILGEARAMPAERVVRFTGEVPIAYHNVRAGVSALQGEETRVRADLPGVDPHALLVMPIVCAQAALFASARAARLDSPPAIPAALVGEGRTLRRQLLEAAEVMADHGLLEHAQVAAVRSGTGLIDMATDCIDLSALYVEHHAAIGGKSPITPAMVRRSGEVGSQLLGILVPEGGRSPVAAAGPVAEAVDVRNRMWTRLVESHALMRRVGGWLWGDQVSHHVPPLRSRRRAAARPPEAPAPAPAR